MSYGGSLKSDFTTRMGTINYMGCRSDVNGRPVFKGSTTSSGSRLSLLRISRTNSSLRHLHSVRVQTSPDRGPRRPLYSPPDCPSQHPVFTQTT